MHIFILRRLLQLIPVLFGVTLVAFLIIQLVPGDVAQVMAGEAASEAQLEQMRENLGLNDPLVVQYGRFLGDLIMFDLGESVRTGQPVMDIIAPRFIITVELALWGMVVAVSVGLFFGILSATYRNTIRDYGTMTLAVVGLSMPNFWLGLLLIYWFSIQLGVLPTSGWGTWQQVIMPAITMGTAGAAVIARMTRSSMLEVIDQDYVRTARAKGVSERFVVYKHAFRNALIPVVTVIGLQFGYFLSGAVLTENVFAINGLGRLVVDAISQRDFPVVQGAVIVLAITFVFVNFLVDIAYRVLNKRIDLN
ncbi:MULTISPECIES: nickel ABC transporter permease [Geomicrobium]|uniref:Nickel import system permease protein NikB n=1 Tax=Geomicrobium sediminis TaxID=1347788 RepID=A0ABS2P9J8_9BACL|nr:MULTISPECIES: nickel ABC transporter permease [unclassified Geomicrobium]MBM7631513.1 peptide/nickel transport system permease protein [Geomicrobium sediminis]GAK00946.1 dipeptide transport system permease protein DppB [Geomicrobium sp. JCM 19055]GAK10154.1 dipeptide transport system permease protein DppB [Geomicrobium sp. JCM 19038]